MILHIDECAGVGQLLMTPGGPKLLITGYFIFIVSLPMAPVLLVHHIAPHLLPPQAPIPNRLPTHPLHTSIHAVPIDRQCCVRVCGCYIVYVAMGVRDGSAMVGWGLGEVVQFVSYAGQDVGQVAFHFQIFLSNLTLYYTHSHSHTNTLYIQTKMSQQQQNPYPSPNNDTNMSIMIGGLDDSTFVDCTTKKSQIQKDMNKFVKKGYGDYTEGWKHGIVFTLDENQCVSWPNYQQSVPVIQKYVQKPHNYNHMNNYNKYPRNNHHHPRTQQYKPKYQHHNNYQLKPQAYCSRNYRNVRKSELKYPEREPFRRQAVISDDETVIKQEPEGPAIVEQQKYIMNQVQIQQDIHKYNHNQHQNQVSNQDNNQNHKQYHQYNHQQDHNQNHNQIYNQDHNQRHYQVNLDGQREKKMQQCEFRPQAQPMPLAEKQPVVQHIVGSQSSPPQNKLPLPPPLQQPEHSLTPIDQKFYPPDLQTMQHSGSTHKKRRYYNQKDSSQYDREILEEVMKERCLTKGRSQEHTKEKQIQQAGQDKVGDDLRKGEGVVFEKERPRKQFRLIIEKAKNIVIEHPPIIVVPKSIENAYKKIKTKQSHIQQASSPDKCPTIPQIASAPVQTTPKKYKIYPDLSTEDIDQIIIHSIFLNQKKIKTKNYENSDMLSIHKRKHKIQGSPNQAQKKIKNWLFGEVMGKAQLKIKTVSARCRCCGERCEGDVVLEDFNKKCSCNRIIHFHVENIRMEEEKLN